MSETEQERIIQLAVERKEFMTDVDGFEYWFPEKIYGYYAAHHLRVLADELDRRNAKVQAEIERYFESQRNTLKE